MFINGLSGRLPPIERRTYLNMVLNQKDIISAHIEDVGTVNIDGTDHIAKATLVTQLGTFVTAINAINAALEAQGIVKTS